MKKIYAKKIYVKKIFRHDCTHQISTTSYIVQNFFEVEGEEEIVVIGKNSENPRTVKILSSTDFRFSGDLKQLIKDECNNEDIAEGDLLIFIKQEDGFLLEVVKRSEDRYTILSDILQPDEEDRHFLLNFDNDRELINKSHQRIFFGAPGTGKSYKLNKEAKEYFKNFERVTFHPNYTYGNFIGAYKPFPVKTGEIYTNNKEVESITYKYVPGPFMKMLIEALKNPSENYLLIIEEINRANTAAVFGDFFQLLDRTNGESEYSICTSEDMKVYLRQELEYLEEEAAEYIIEKLGTDFERIILPNNLYIWATMNSSDQGIMPLDTAFKRRWEFEYLGIDAAVNENQEGFDNYRFRINSTETVKWNDFRMKLNEKLCKYIPEDKLIGPYFIPKSILDNSSTIEGIDKLTETIGNKVLMYLFEDAAKTFKSELFEEGKYSTYSMLRDNFNNHALEIFKEPFEIETFPLNIQEETQNITENTEV